MQPSAPTPRKERTRQHVIAALSVNYVERFILEEGHVAQRVESDYGYDLLLFTHDARGRVEPGFVFLQLKASERLRRNKSGRYFVFDMEIEDCNLWTAEVMPVYLVLYDAGRRKAYWLDVQRYFSEATSRRPRRGTTTKRVYVPARQAINGRAIGIMRERKQACFVDS